MPTPKISTVSLLLLLAISLHGCGRKGPLYMQPTPIKPAPAIATQPEKPQAAPNSTTTTQPEVKK